MVSVALDSVSLSINDTYITVKSRDACVKLGTSVMYYEEHSGYAHTNVDVLGELS